METHDAYRLLTDLTEAGFDATMRPEHPGQIEDDETRRWVIELGVRRLDLDGLAKALEIVRRDSPNAKGDVDSDSRVTLRLT